VSCTSSSTKDSLWPSATRKVLGGGKNAKRPPGEDAREKGRIAQPREELIYVEIWGMALEG